MRARRRHDRGAVLLVTVVLLGALALAGVAAVQFGLLDVRMSGEFMRSAQAFYAAEAGVERGLAELDADGAWAGTSATLSNGARYTVTVAAPTATTRLLTATGTRGSSTRTLAYALIREELTAYPLLAAGDLRITGTPAIDAPGARIGGNAYLDLGTGTAGFSLHRPSGASVYVNGSTVVTQAADEPLDAPGLRLTRRDWFDLAREAAASATHDADGRFFTADTETTITNLSFPAVAPGPTGRRTVVVDGDVTLAGSLTGQGAVVATGRVTFAPTCLTGAATVAIAAGSDVVLDAGETGGGTLTGYIYSEGDVTIAGNVSFTGMVIALGSVFVLTPDAFHIAADQAAWDALSGAGALVASPLHGLSWQEPE